jgi:hypothetical protein
VPPDRSALRSALRAVIDRRDPEGLLAFGAPTDEYDPEAADLARLRSSRGRRAALSSRTGQAGVRTSPNW